MILVIGELGFTGGSLLSHLTSMGKTCRVLLPTGSSHVDFPIGVNIDVAVSSLRDARGLRAAIHDVDTVFFLAGIERHAQVQRLDERDVEGIETLVSVLKSAKINRLIYLSHLGADRASAFYLMKVKGISEHFIRESGLPYTIVRSSMVYGPGDWFTMGLSKVIKSLPYVIPVPENGNVLLQPLLLDDMVTALAWCLDMPDTRDRTIEIGGPEQLTFQEMVKQIATAVGRKRKFVSFSPVQFGIITQLLESLVKGLPSSAFWTDYLAENRTCALDSLPRIFGIVPARFHQSINYLTR